MMRVVVGLLLSCFCIAASAEAAKTAGMEKGQGQRYAQLDAHALAAPKAAESSVESLASYLIQPARTDAEKARVIFTWMADRISYDLDAFHGKKPFPDMSAEGVLATRSSICEGYANLFQRLASLAKLEVASIRGFAKGYGAPVAQVTVPDHAWNAVRVDGQWRLLDSTWGAGHVADGKFKKAFNELYFLASPEHLMFTHFPEDPAWQLQSTGRLSREQFNTLPPVRADYFGLGIKGETLWQVIQESRNQVPLVQVHDVPWNAVSVQAAPLLQGLKPGKEYEFRIGSLIFEKMAIIQNQTWIEMEKENDDFFLRFTPESSGTILVAGKRPTMTVYDGILSYRTD